jgi:hypothetical protein
MTRTMLAICHEQSAFLSVFSWNREKSEAGILIRIGFNPRDDQTTNFF